MKVHPHRSRRDYRGQTLSQLALEEAAESRGGLKLLGVLGLICGALAWWDYRQGPGTSIATHLEDGQVVETELRHGETMGEMLERHHAELEGARANTPTPSNVRAR